MKNGLTPNWFFSAEAVHFIESLIQEQAPGSHLIIDVDHGGTPQANLSLKFELSKNIDQSFDFINLTESTRCYSAKESFNYLKDLKINLKKELLHTELEITAPHLFGNKQQLSLLDEVTIFFNQEILPFLKQHKGHASFQEITQDGYLVLKFEGGCQGCSMAKVTLKQGIEQRIKERFPNIEGIIDMTDHSQGTAAYA